MKSVLKVAFVSIFLLAAMGLASAQAPNTSSFPVFNLGPCDFSNQFYQDNGLDLSRGSELNTEPDGRFGTFRQFGPPATGSQANWVADEDNCFERDPTRRDFRILATTGGNADDANSPFTCSDQVFNTGGPGCANQPGIPETLDFISILAFLHNENTFIGAHAAGQANYNRTVGFINGGLEGVQQNPGIDISITQGQDPQLAPEDTTVPGEPPVTAGLSPRGESMQFIVSNFEAYGAIDQFKNTLKCPAGATLASQCRPAPGNFAGAPCSLLMIQHLQNPAATTLPTFCFNVADTKDSHGNTISDVATPKLRQNWRFATNRNAMDGSDNNGVGGQDSPYGYFCDDLLGMWIITYFWFTHPPNTSDTACSQAYNAIGSGKEPLGNGQFAQVQGNGFSPDGFPVVLTANELNNWLEGTAATDGTGPCGAEGQEDPGGTDGGAAWLVCPAIPDPRNGGITSDAFLDVTTHNSLLDPFVISNFKCLQQTGKFCFESAPGQ
ncbi:MAG TPA: hypothetical protein VKH81_16240 [Candidatus Angelobacter sp.]|nr:hypothetical protein [Candidatus Angelobacter sp.]